MRNFIKKYFELIESVFLLTFAFGLLLLANKMLTAQYIVWTGAVGLSFIYLIRSFDSPKNNFFDFLIYKFAWLGPVIAIFGMIAKLLLLEKSYMLLWIGFFLTLLGLAGGILRKFEKQEIFEKLDYPRLAVILIITFLFAIL